MRKLQGSPDRKALSTLSNNVSNLPVSPTANLKLLTKVASELASPVRNLRAPGGRVASRGADPKTRKEKSLGILCDRFLAMFPLDLPYECQVMEICLDHVAAQLGIVKRRIYDIINILESLHMATKVAKNRYHWHGSKNLPTTLSQLKAMALESGIDEKLQNIQTKQRTGFRLVSGPTCCCSKDATASHFRDEGPSTDEGESSALKSANGFFSDERTLGVMCLKFIMLFLSSPLSGAKINLDLATRMLVSEAADTTERELWGMKVECHKGPGEQMCGTAGKSCKCMLRLKTKVRRLYDIANVLTSLGLISKIETSTNSMRKPIFSYTGPAVTVMPKKNSVPLNFKNFISTTSCDEDEGVENKLNLGLKRKDSTSREAHLPPKFPRIASENNFGLSLQRCKTSHNLSARHISSGPSVRRDVNHPQYQCSLDDILQVAGQELEKIRTSEELAAQKLSTARKKLSFSRCHSDSCIQTPLALQQAKDDPQNGTPCPSTVSNPVTGEQASSTNKKSVCVTLMSSKTKCFTITRKLVEVPMHVIPQKFSGESSINLRNITPMQAQTLNSIFGLSDQKHVKKSTPPLPYSVASTNADVANNNKPTPSLVVSNPTRHVSSSSNTCGVPSQVAPGELYRAIKVGNVVRLVPFITTSKSNI